jgi:hypothetical protein
VQPIRHAAAALAVLLDRLVRTTNVSCLCKSAVLLFISYANISSRQTVTITNTTVVTVSHVATAIVTVLQAAVDTSTIFSTVQVTVSSADTQTVVTYVTTTVPAAATKRAVSGRVYSPGGDEGLGILHRIYKRLASAWQDLASRSPAEFLLLARQAIPTGTLAPTNASTTTITVQVTRISDVTNIISSTTTAQTTSITLTTLLQTVTTYVYPR